ncbi:Uridine-cytidine kinase 2 [Physocladia obscura]|uniref:uridine/cytidine kinase n=1 Tax=Physocladia obscura TaxID=109957 RepID=A0AAD5XBK9_9FUNG|nr:Uridine-cytidine kinase 2 [Physocladia obscura]
MMQRKFMIAQQDISPYLSTMDFEGPELTDETLATLAANNAIATFFLIGAGIVDNPNSSTILPQIIAAGHQIAMHTWSHHPVTLWDSDIFISETILTAKSIYDIIGKIPRYWRPPYSSLDDRIRFILYAMGLRPVVWNIESDDTTMAEPADGIPQSENRQGVLSTQETVFDHIVSSVEAKRDDTWAYFPGYSPDGTNSTYVGGDVTYKGFVVLEHDIYEGEESLIKQVVPWVATQSNLTMTTVNKCDRILANASMYLPDDHPLVQFVKTITLPLTEADLAAYTGPPFTYSTASSATQTDAVTVSETVTHSGSKKFAASSSGATSGKKSVCGQIIEKLQEGGVVDRASKVAIIKMENFCLGSTDDSPVDNFYSTDSPNAMDFELLAASLETLKQGKPCTIPEWDFISHKRVDSTIAIIHVDVVLVVGTLALYYKKVRDLFDLKIFVDVDSDLRLARQVVRDTEERSPTKPLETVLNNYLNVVKPSFEDFILPTKKYANVIIPRGPDNTVAITLIARHIIDILKQTKAASSFPHAAPE